MSELALSMTSVSAKESISRQSYTNQAIVQDGMEATIAVYDRIAETHAERWVSAPATRPLLARFLQHVPPGTILDVGCGVGRDVHAILNAGRTVVGIDLSPGMLREAKRRNPEAVLRWLDMRNLPFPPAAFSGVWSMASLHHLAPVQAHRALRELQRVLKPKGILGLTVEEGEGEEVDAFGRYRCFYAADSLGRLLAETGFECLEVFRSRSGTALPPDTVPRNWLFAIAAVSRETSVAAEAEGCPLCATDRFAVNQCINVAGAEAIIASNERMVVFPDLAPLAKGHVLIATHEHVANVATLPRPHLQNLQDAMDAVTDLTVEAFGSPPAFFEHGAGVARHGGACIDHAHVHALPLPFNLLAEPELLALPHRDLDGFEDLQSFAAGGQPYLFVQQGGRQAAFKADGVPSQFLRRLIARRMGLGAYRWQDLAAGASTKQRFQDTWRALVPIADRRRHSPTQETRSV